MESTAVKYFMQRMLARPSTLECTTQALVSDINYNALVLCCKCAGFRVYLSNFFNKNIISAYCHYVIFITHLAVIHHIQEMTDLIATTGAL